MNSNYSGRHRGAKGQSVKGTKAQRDKGTEYRRDRETEKKNKKNEKLQRPYCLAKICTFCHGNISNNKDIS